MCKTCSLSFFFDKHKIIPVLRTKNWPIPSYITGIAPILVCHCNADDSLPKCGKHFECNCLNDTMLEIHLFDYIRVILQFRGFALVRPGSDAVLHMSRIECKWAKSFVLPHLHSIRLMWSMVSKLGLRTITLCYSRSKTHLFIRYSRNTTP